MEFEWDEVKRLRNLAKHALDFADAEEFDWSGAIRWPDSRKDYGEARFLALGEFRSRTHSISFRAASRRELRRYDEEKKTRR